MILELAIIDAQPGQGAALEAALKNARSVLERADGYRGSTFHRGIEKPDQVVLTIHWETLEHHTEGFRGGPLFPEWRSHFGHLMAGAPNVFHYTPFIGGEGEPR